MNIERFSRLTTPQQHYYIQKCGAYLSSRHERNFSAELFAVSDYYVELIYPHGDLKCSLVRTFTFGTFPDGYLKDIDISGLLPLTIRKPGWPN